MGYEDDDYDDDYQDDESYLEKDSGSSVLPIVITLGVVFLVLAGAGMVFFRFAGATGHRKAGNEAAAIGSLKAISMAQTLHREGDKDGDGILDYAANLQELGQGQLIDSVLASGAKHGYLFETYNGPQTEFEWFATADPEEPGVTGLRFFYVDQSGVVFYSTRGPIQGPIDFNKLPPGVLPVGQ